MNNHRENNIPKIQVICSTLNQMVNYITIKTFEPESIINLTLQDSSDNKRWDDYLKKVIGENRIEDIAVSRHIVCDHEKLKEDIKKKIQTREPLLWNITGGQRYFTLAVFELFRERPQDFLCYLEGNSNQIFVLENRDNGRIEKYRKDIPPVHLPCITVETALRLMGFEAKERGYDYKITFNNGNCAVINGEGEDKMEEFVQFLPAFQKLETDTEFRKICFEANREEINAGSLDSLKIKNALTSEGNGRFGKPFEWMVGAKIKEVIVEKKLPVNEMIISQKVNLAGSLKIDNRSVDEFDIILTTSNGKVVVFELKSGRMNGDVAKGTKYSTYAVGGVYGLPILIVPLKKNELNDPKERLHGTVNAARRATLEVRGIDEIEEKLAAKLKTG